MMVLNTQKNSVSQLHKAKNKNRAQRSLPSQQGKALTVNDSNVTVNTDLQYTEFPRKTIQGSIRPLQDSWSLCCHSF